MYQAPICNFYIPMDFPDVFEYVPEPPEFTPILKSPRLPITLEGYDVEPCPAGSLLDKDEVVLWAKDTLRECYNEPTACARLTQLIAYLIADE